MNNTASVVVDFLHSTVFLTVIVWGAAMIGCSNSASNMFDMEPEVGGVTEPQTLHPLAWVESAVVKKDIARAVNKKDFRLLAFGGRQMTIPGIDDTQLSTAEKICGFRVLAATGDALESKRDQLLRSKVLRYATEYNSAMLAFCKSVNS